MRSPTRNLDARAFQTRNDIESWWQGARVGRPALPKTYRSNIGKICIGALRSQVWHAELVTEASNQNG